LKQFHPASFFGRSRHSLLEDRKAPNYRCGKYGRKCDHSVYVPIVPAVTVIAPVPVVASVTAIASVAVVIALTLKFSGNLLVY